MNREVFLDFQLSFTTADEAQNYFACELEDFYPASGEGEGSLASGKYRVIDGRLFFVDPEYDPMAQPPEGFADEV
jgi:hypothetical protein